MITTFDHLLDYQETQKISQFLIYSLFVWAIMLPRTFCACLYYFSIEASFDLESSKNQSISIVKKIILICILASFILSTILMLRVSLAFGIISYLGTFLLALLYLASIPQSFLSKYIERVIPYPSHVKLLKQRGNWDWKPTLNIAYITIFNPPDLSDFEEKLKSIRKCFEASGVKFKIFGVIDGVGAYENSNLAVEIAKKYCDFVSSGNFQRKRENLRWMINQTWDMGLINQLNQSSTIMHFIDDDTIPEDYNLVNKLTRNFVNPLIGGVTTKQFVYKPRFFWQHVMQIFESARNYGSQACLSLFGSVGCMPGRWYCVRGSLITKVFLHS